MLALCSLALLAAQAGWMWRERSLPATGNPVPTPSLSGTPVEERIPASFMGEKRAGTLDLSQAKARVSANPAFLLEKDAFFSTINQTDSSTYRIGSSDVVADVGCGTGALEFKLLRERVAFKRLYAVDVDRGSLEFLQFALAALKHPDGERIETVHSKMEDVCLPEASIDVMIVYNTPIGATPPQAKSSGPMDRDLPLIRSLARAMRPGGRLHFVLFCKPRVYESVRPTFEKESFRTVSQTLLSNGISLVFTTSSRLPRGALPSGASPSGAPVTP